MPEVLLVVFSFQVPLRSGVDDPVWIIAAAPAGVGSDAAATESALSYTILRSALMLAERIWEVAVNVLPSSDAENVNVSVSSEPCTLAVSFATREFPSHEH